MQAALELEDIWRINNSNLRKYTWFSSKQPRQMARLDFFLTTPDIHSQVKKHSISHGYRTDHSLLNLEINPFNSKRGKGFWKFNTSLLHDTAYIQLVKQVIETTVCDYSVDKNDSNLGQNQMLFELIKLNIRGHTIAYSTKKAKDNKDNEIKLEKKITQLENNLMDACLSNDMGLIKEIETNLQIAKADLSILRDRLVRAYILRSKVQYYEEGEKATKYFCNLEKRNYINKVIHKLNLDGKIITDPSEILTEQKRFYNNIYSSKVSGNPCLRAKFFTNKNIKKLDPEDKISCEGEITESEAKIVLKNMKNNKTPGTDGFPVEFYKFFWNDISSFLINSFNEAFTKGELSITQKQGIIICLPKGNKPREFLKHRRPISLLNIDYKKVLADRLKKILPKIISETQKGFLQGTLKTSDKY